MKIIYLTSSITENDFAFLEEKAIVKPNPAGQNFHQRLIHALAKFNELHVISLIPNRERIIEEKSFEEEDIHYTYVNPINGRIKQILFSTSNITKRIVGEADVVIYDTLSLSLASASKAVAKKVKAPRVAICTDSPYNITGTNFFYRNQVLSLSRSADGYFCLTGGLNILFNKKHRPRFIRPGIVEPMGLFPNPHPRPYFYYGGALFVKDGTEALIQAYQESNADYDLVIAGHGDYEGEVKKASLSNPRIHYLGQISKKENAAYEQHADLLINPRLFNQRLDEVSIPSKVLEYAALGSRIVSTKSSTLSEYLAIDIHWMEDGRELINFLRQHLDEQGKLKGVKQITDRWATLTPLCPDEIGLTFSKFLWKSILHRSCREEWEMPDIVYNK